ncbi:hypothetical protein LEP1GSC125_1156 [Leptospira mayottensis 200901122]|uniref:Uncharacterized protein n=1 Tax=Leptospira mayottensis 200901122 TaxID=1193010 RepID=A0AA87MR77_9LEPT|nr:hypothetical protein LEP1GSC125_1156 [Leptospira mayottensis 200901122]
MSESPANFIVNDSERVSQFQFRLKIFFKKEHYSEYNAFTFYY